MSAIDHVVFNTQERTDEVVDFFERIGFTVTSRGFHTLGSINHTIVFGRDYLELLGYPPGHPPAKRPELVTQALGLMATVLATQDADATHAGLRANGLQPRPVQSFSRPVDLGAGNMKDASFRVTRLAPDAVPGTWFYYCQHLTPELVWRPEWQAHANGATGISALDIDVPDMALALQNYRACVPGSGPETLGRSGSSAIFSLRDCALRLHQLPGVARMRALTIRVASLDPALRLLQRNHIKHAVIDQTIILDPASSFGATLQLCASAVG